MRNFPLATVELEKVYRQKDADFLGLLNRVRDNSVTGEDITHLNSSARRGAKPEADWRSISPPPMRAPMKSIISI